MRRIRFSRRELRDLGIAWVVLSLAFTAFYPAFRPALLGLTSGAATGSALRWLALGTAVSFVTVGVGFLLHELAHKVVAIRYGQVAEFRADYNMLLLALLAGFNMIPFGPLDGRKVLSWNRVVYAATAVPMIGLGVWAIFGIGI